MVLRFVLKNFVSCYDELVWKAKSRCFQGQRGEKMATEVFEILNHINPDYFENPYNSHDNDKLVQFMNTTTSHGTK